MPLSGTRTFLIPDKAFDRFGLERDILQFLSDVALKELSGHREPVNSAEHAGVFWYGVCGTTGRGVWGVPAFLLS